MPRQWTRGKFPPLTIQICVTSLWRGLTYDASQVHSAYSEATRGVKELRPERRMPKIKPHGSTSLQNAIEGVMNSHLLWMQGQT